MNIPPRIASEKKLPYISRLFLSRYTKDANGECRKPLHIDKNEQLNFLLQHLNTVYEPSPNQQPIRAPFGNKMESSGPFQVNIPIFPNVQKSPESEDNPVPTLQNSDEETTKPTTIFEPNEGTTTETIPVTDVVDDKKNAPPESMDYKVADNTKDELEKETTFSEPTTTEKPPPKEISPTLVLVLAPANSSPENETSLGHVILRVTNTTGNWTSKEIITSIIPLPSIEPEIRNVTESNNNSTQEMEEVYADDEGMSLEEEPDYSTEDGFTESPEDDDFAETTDDELLKPGEAGITIPVTKTQETTELPDTPTPASVDIPDSVAQNNVSKVSVKDDFTLETTILDVVGPLQKNATEASKLEVPPHVVVPAQGQNPVIVEVKDPPKESGFVLRDEVIDPQASFNSEKIVPPDSGKIPAAATNFRRHQNFVRFPGQEEEKHQTPSHVRFPSDEVNSIHGSDHKTGAPFAHEATSTKSSVPMLKPSHWQVPQGNQPPSAFRASQSEPSRKQQPPLLRFWAKMPLMRDPSLYPNPGLEPIGVPRFPAQSRRVNFEREPTGG